MGDRRKGKEKMSNEELEEEERKESQMKYIEKVRKNYAPTQLSKLINRISPDGLGDLTRFSWRYPAYFGVKGWGLIVGKNAPPLPSHQSLVSGRYWVEDVIPRSNPLPQPTYQGSTSNCVPHTVYHLLMLQLSIVSKFHRVPCPMISLPHLIQVRKTLEETKRSTGYYLAALKKIGVYQESEYDALTRKPIVDTPSFPISSASSFTGENLNRQEFGLAIARAIAEFGGVIITVPTYDERGDRRIREVRVLKEDENSEEGKVNMYVNHALCGFEWERRVDGVYGFVCIDSATGGFRILWLDEIDSIEMVYVVQLKTVESVRKSIINKIKDVLSKIE